MYPSQEVFPQIKQLYLREQSDIVDDFYKQFGPNILELMAKKAAKVRENAYAPYSNYLVGAAVLTKGGEIVLGVNSEAISYTQTAHAEETAIRSAIIQGAIKELGQHFIAAILYVSSGSDFGAPCGHCRQIIREHADNCVVAQGTIDGEVKHVATLDLLLPLGFSVLNTD